MSRFLLLSALALVSLDAGAQTQGSRENLSDVQTSGIAPLSNEQLARDWGLKPEEWTRYRQLMQGPLGVYSPNVDPLSALGIEAQSEDERQRYAELQVLAEARRVEKLLAYQRAYDIAWRKQFPGLLPVNLAGSKPPTGLRAPQGSGRLALFVKADCPPCVQQVKSLQSAGTAFDLYLVGSRQDDSRIRRWARQVGLEPTKVHDRIITLNHDGGRWLSLGLPGELPALVREVNGQWQRQ
jgi:integrating conjugative element protein (TIGR03759 family)